MAAADTQAASPLSPPPPAPELPDYVTDPNAVLKDKTARWRYGVPPDYSKTRKVYETTKKKDHAAGSLEQIVENLVKNWEIEASFKPVLSDWRTVDHEKYTFVINGGPPQGAEVMLEVGTYNAIIAPNEYYSPEYSNFASSHKTFKRMMPTFAWEVLEVYSGPPKVAFRWRHWGTMKNDYVGFNDKGEKVMAKAHGGAIDIEGVTIAAVDDKLRVQTLETWFDPMEMFRQIAPNGVVNKVAIDRKVSPEDQVVSRDTTCDEQAAAETVPSADVNNDPGVEEKAAYDHIEPPTTLVDFDSQSGTGTDVSSSESSQELTPVEQLTPNAEQANWVWGESSISGVGLDDAPPMTEQVDEESIAPAAPAKVTEGEDSSAGTAKHLVNPHGEDYEGLSIGMCPFMSRFQDWKIENETPDLTSSAPSESQSESVADSAPSEKPEDVTASGLRVATDQTYQTAQHDSQSYAEVLRSRRSSSDSSSWTRISHVDETSPVSPKKSIYSSNATGPHEVEASDPYYYDGDEDEADQFWDATEAHHTCPNGMGTAVQPEAGEAVVAPKASEETQQTHQEMDVIRPEQCPLFMNTE